MLNDYGVYVGDATIRSLDEAFDAVLTHPLVRRLAPTGENAFIVRAWVRDLMSAAGAKTGAQAIAWLDGQLIQHNNDWHEVWRRYSHLPVAFLRARAAMREVQR